MKKDTRSVTAGFGSDGFVRARKGQGDSDVSVLFSGDVCPLNGYADCFARGQVEELLSDVMPVCRSADLHITNLELSLTRRGRPITKCGPNFRGSPDAVRGLKQLGVTHACLANNHIRDFGDQGIRDTLRVLDDNRIRSVGIASGLNAAMAPVFFRKKGVKFCLLNVAEAEYGYPQDGHLGASFLDEPVVMETLRDAAPRADVTVVVVHAGREYQYLPPVWMQAMCRRFVTCGADLVIAHHAHVPQGVEILPTGAICYSLGNFVFDYGPHGPMEGTRLGYMVRCGLDRKGLVDLTIIPTVKHEDLSVTLLPAAARAEFLRFLDSVSQPFQDDARSLAIWKEYIREDAPLYLGALRNHMATLAKDRVSMPEYDGMLLYAYLAGCRAHREIAGACARLVFEKEMPSVPSSARVLRRWETMVSRVLAGVS